MTTNINNENIELLIKPLEKKKHSFGIFVKNLNYLHRYEIEFGFDARKTQAFHIEPNTVQNNGNKLAFSLEEKIHDNKVYIKYSNITKKIISDIDDRKILEISSESESPIDVLNTKLIKEEGEVLHYSILNKNSKLPLIPVQKSIIISSFMSPFTNELSIQYRIAKEGNVSISTHEFFGKLIHKTKNIYHKKGEYSITLNTDSYPKESLYVFCLNTKNKMVSSRIIKINTT